MTEQEVTTEKMWIGADKLFYTEAEAIGYRTSFIEDVLSRPSVFITVKPVKPAEDGGFIVGNLGLTDSQILSGEFSGYYSVTSPHNGFNSLGIEASVLPYFIDNYQANYLAMIPEVSEIMIPEVSEIMIPEVSEIETLTT